MINTNIVDVKAFANEILERLRKVYPAAEINITEVMKNNDKILIGLAINEKEGAVVPQIYINDLYEKYVEEKADIEEITLTVQHLYDDKKKEADRMHIDIKPFLDADNLKAKVFVRLLGIDNNREYLRDAVYCPMCDNLAAVFYVLFDRTKEGVATAKLSKKSFDELDMTKEELYSIALENTVEFFPAVMKTMKKILQSQLGLSDVDGMSFDAEMYVLSNDVYINGATVLLYPEVLKKFCREKGVERIIILPSSVHETLLLLPSVLMDKEYMKEMVMDINEGVLRPEDVLSDDVYVYTLADDEIHVL